jgi:hypothetical protein
MKLEKAQILLNNFIDNGLFKWWCRFLEVDSWNTQHGFDASDSVEEKIVEEMKAVQVLHKFASTPSVFMNQFVLRMLEIYGVVR